MGGTVFFVEAEGQGRGQRHATNAVGLAPGDSVSLDMAGCSLIDIGLDLGEFLCAERGLAGEVQADDVFVRNVACFLIVGTNLAGKRIVFVDQHGEFVGLDSCSG